MKEHSRKLLNKAIDSIEVAEFLVDKEKADIAVARAYYAMFYIAEALLNEKGLKFSKHSAVHADFAKQGIITDLPLRFFCHHTADAYAVFQR